MAFFVCEKCGKQIIESPLGYGYITECKHYPFVSNKIPKMGDVKT